MGSQENKKEKPLLEKEVKELPNEFKKKEIDPNNPTAVKPKTTTTKSDSKNDGAGLDSKDGLRQAAPQDQPNKK